MPPALYNRARGVRAPQDDGFRVYQVRGLIGQRGVPYGGVAEGFQIALRRVLIQGGAYLCGAEITEQPDPAARGPAVDDREAA